MSDLLNKASLVMVPSGYKEDTVYSVIPTDGSGDLSFTRASNGTRVNSAGLVEVCPWNLAEYSENIGTSPWTTPNVTITSGQTDPNGGNTAFLVVESTNGGSLRQAITQTGQLCYSIVLKYSSGTNKKASLFCTDASQQAGFDLEFGTVSYESGSTATIESLGNGWYKCAMTFTPSSASTLILFPNYESGIGGVFAWHPQLNIGSTAKPYFPTTDRLNVPRLTYQNGGGGCPSLLLEKQSTNIVTYSEQFDNANWNKYQCSISANQTTSPDGTQNADKLTLAGGSGTYTGLTYRLTTLGANSIFMKNDSIGNGKFYIQVDGIGNASWNANGTLASVSGGTATNGENMGNGWFRFTYVCSGGAYINYGIENGTTGDSIFIWGAQVEASSYPTSYIPTTSSSATRVADACYKTGISSLIGQTEGTMFVNYNSISNNSSGRAMTINDYPNTSYNNRIAIINDGGVIRVFISKGGIVQFDETNLGTFIGTHKIAIAYKSDDLKVYVDGVAVTSRTSGFDVPTCSSVTIGTFENNSDDYPIQGTILQSALFKTRLTNAELASLTTI